MSSTTLTSESVAPITALVEPTAAPVPGRAARITGWVITALTTAFLVVDAVSKLVGAQTSVDATVALGFSADLVVPIGVLLLASVVLSAIPRTTFLGTLLLTAYLGGAVCANLRAEMPLVSHVLFPVYVGVLVWAGLFLRSATVRALVLAGR